VLFNKASRALSLFFFLCGLVVESAKDNGRAVALGQQRAFFFLLFPACPCSRVPHSVRRNCKRRQLSAEYQRALVESSLERGLDPPSLFPFSFFFLLPCLFINSFTAPVSNRIYRNVVPKPLGFASNVIRPLSVFFPFPPCSAKRTPQLVRLGGETKSYALRVGLLQFLFPLDPFVTEHDSELRQLIIGYLFFFLPLPPLSFFPLTILGTAGNVAVNLERADFRTTTYPATGMLPFFFPSIPSQTAPDKFQTTDYVARVLV